MNGNKTTNVRLLTKGFLYRIKNYSIMDEKDLVREIINKEWFIFGTQVSSDEELGYGRTRSIPRPVQPGSGRTAPGATRTKRGSAEYDAFLQSRGQTEIL